MTTLLELALAHEHLIRSNHSLGAFSGTHQPIRLAGPVILTRRRHTIEIELPGYPATCIVWYADLQTYTWTRRPHLQRLYRRWAENARVYWRYAKGASND